MSLTLTVNDADCAARRCDYYRHYLAYGPATLVHEGYHAAMDHCLEAQTLYLAHLDSCKLCNTGYIDSCSQEKRLSRIARSWEERVRA